MKRKIILKTISGTLVMWIFINASCIASNEKNSLLLIEEALRNDSIDYNTSIVYKIYAISKPDLLPEQFKSSLPIKCGTQIILEMIKNWDKLDDQTRKIIQSSPYPNQRSISPGNPMVEKLPWCYPTPAHFVVYYSMPGDSVFDLTIRTVDAVDPTDTNGVNDWQSFTDTNGNGHWDPGEPLNNDVGIDGVPNTGDYGEGDGRPNPPEAFQDNNGNSTWDPGESFLDSIKYGSNGHWDKGEPNSEPDYIENISTYLEYCWNFETSIGAGQLGYAAPYIYGKMKIHIQDQAGGYGVTWPIYDDDPTHWGNPRYLNPNHAAEIGIDNDFAGQPPYPDNDDPEGRVKGAMKVTSAHEFFHTIQFGLTYDINEDDWWMEASATWMEDTVYNQVNDYKFYYGESYIDTNNNGRYDTGEAFTDLNHSGTRNEGWFDYPERTISSIEDLHEYGSSIFCKYLTERKSGSWPVSIIREIWEECIGKTQSLDAIDKVLSTKLGIRSGGLEKIFPEFTVCNFIQKPTAFIDDKYSYADDASGDYPDIKVIKTYNPNPTDNQHYIPTYPPRTGGELPWEVAPIDLPYLSAQYIKILPPGLLDKPTKLSFDFHAGAPGSWTKNVILVRQDDKKEVYDITQGPFRFGTTKGSEKPDEVKEAILVITRTATKGKKENPGKYKAVIAPQFREVYTPDEKTRTTKTIKNLNPRGSYKNGEPIKLENYCLRKSNSHRRFFKNRFYL